MANKSAEFIIDSLGNRWRAYAGTAAATLVVASPAVSDLREMHQLSNVIVSVRNPQAAATTVVMSIRNVSIAGTVMSAVDITVANATTSTQNLKYDLPGKRGGVVSVDLGLLATSVTGQLTITGWKEIGR